VKGEGDGDKGRGKKMGSRKATSIPWLFVVTIEEKEGGWKRKKETNSGQ
jgi:hypothetical protein